MANEKFCVNCKHHELWYVKDNPSHRCTLFKVSRRDLVTGEMIVLDSSNNCYYLRDIAGKCGINPRFYEPKEA